MKTTFLILAFLVLCSSFDKKPKVKLGIIVYSHFDKKLIKNIQKKGHKMYGAKIKTIGNSDLPDSSSVFYGYTYSAYAFIANLQTNISKKHTNVIGLTTKSLIIPDLFFSTFVYGFSENKVCIVSDFMIDGDQAVYMNRVTNVVLHEIGHLYGLHHCDDENCLMVRYDRLDNFELCDNCKQRLKLLKKQGYSTPGSH